MGGDWYDVFAVDGGLCFVIGDVAGHGIRSAPLMARLRDAVRTYAYDDPAPARVLSRLNQMMCRHEPGDTATAIVAIWDLAACSIVQANAGHPPVLRCQVGRSDFLPTGGVLLGVDPDLVYPTVIEATDRGTTLLFYTDGLIESRALAVDDGMADLQRFVTGLTDLSPEFLCDEVLRWRRRSARGEDDLCLLAARLG